MIQRLTVAPKGAIDLQYAAMDPESYALANELRAVLLAAGWTVTRFNGGLYAGPVQTGIVLEVQNSDNPPARAVVLRAVLEDVGLATSLQTGNPNWDVDTLNMDVLTKPI